MQSVGIEQISIWCVISNLCKTSPMPIRSKQDKPMPSISKTNNLNMTIIYIWRSQASLQSHNQLRYLLDLMETICMHLTDALLNPSSIQEKKIRVTR